MKLELTLKELETLCKILQDSYYKSKMNLTDSSDLEKVWKKLEDYRINLLRNKYETKTDVEK